MPAGASCRVADRTPFNLSAGDDVLCVGRGGELERVAFGHGAELELLVGAPTVEPGVRGRVPALDVEPEDEKWP